MILAKYSWKEIALCLPELLSEAWQQLAWLYWKDKEHPYLLSAHIHDTGRVEVKYRVAGFDEPMSCAFHPFGLGADGREKIKGFVEQCNQQLEEKMAEIDEKLRGFADFCSSFIPEPRKRR